MLRLKTSKAPIPPRIRFSHSHLLILGILSQISIYSVFDVCVYWYVWGVTYILGSASQKSRPSSSPSFLMSVSCIAICLFPFQTIFQPPEGKERNFCFRDIVVAMLGAGEMRCYPLQGDLTSPCFFSSTSNIYRSSSNMRKWNSTNLSKFSVCFLWWGVNLTLSMPFLVFFFSDKGDNFCPSDQSRPCRLLFSMFFILGKYLLTWMSQCGICTTKCKFLEMITSIPISRTKV